MNASSTSALEAERQVVEATKRHRKVVASMEAGGRPEAGQRAAVKSVGRALQLVAFVLKRAAAVGISLERLAELTERDAELVRQALERRSGTGAGRGRSAARDRRPCPPRPRSAHRSCVP